MNHLRNSSNIFGNNISMESLDELKEFREELSKESLQKFSKEFYQKTPERIRQRVSEEIFNKYFYRNPGRILDRMP